MLLSDVAQQYYKRSDIQQELLQAAQNREIALRYTDMFGKRPDTLRYPTDIAAQAENKVTSFHCSEERWSNPMLLSTSMKKTELDELRIGWDIILDIDCGVFEYSRLAALVIIEALQSEGVHTPSIKFSGNKGFHIGIPFEAFPPTVNNKSVAQLFPEAARRIAAYLREIIMEELKKRIIQFEHNSFAKVLAKTKLSAAEIQWETKGVDAFLEIDTVLISSRHLYRMAYSLHEKSGLVSLPLSLDELETFTREQATPSKVKVIHHFLPTDKVKSNEAQQLFVNAFDAEFKQSEVEHKREPLETLAEAIPEQYFPSCIKQLLQGLEDGRKRALFVLVNFLLGVGWGKEAVEERLKEWNTVNNEPLSDTYITGHVRYASQRRLLPPNCSNATYYSSLNVHCTDSLCKKSKNPVIAARIRVSSSTSSAKEKVKKENKQTQEK